MNSSAGVQRSRDSIIDGSGGIIKLRGKKRLEKSIGFDRRSPCLWRMYYFHVSELKQR